MYPGITTILLLAIRGEPIPEAEEFGPGDADLATAISEQNKIGRGIVKYSFLSQAWERSQTQYTEARGLEAARAKKRHWITMLHKNLWEYVSAIWEQGNASAHGDNKPTQRRIRLQQLRDQGKSVQRRPPLLSAHGEALLTLTLTKKAVNIYATGCRQSKPTTKNKQCINGERTETVLWCT